MEYIFFHNPIRVADKAIWDKYLWQETCKAE